MPHSCVFYNCKRRGNKGFFGIPNDLSLSNARPEKKKLAKARQAKWLKIINRRDILDDPEKLENFIAYGKVCCQHFVSGRPIRDPNSIDFAPSLNLGYAGLSPGKRKTQIMRKQKLDGRARSINVSDESDSQSEQEACKMPSKCGVSGCEPGGQEKIFNIPTDPRPSSNKIQLGLTNLATKRRDLWLKMIGRSFASEKEISKFCDNFGVCGRHFYMGRPADMDDEDNIDWFPRLQLGNVPENDVERLAENEAIREVRAVMQSLSGTPAQPTCVFLPNADDSDDSDPNDNDPDDNAPEDNAPIMETVYECGFCKQKFQTIPLINAHIQSEHSDVRRAGDEELIKKAKPIYKELIRCFDAFDWCNCRICVTSLRNLLSHVHEMHQTPAVKWASAMSNKADTSDTENQLPEVKLPREPAPSIVQTANETLVKPRFIQSTRKPHYSIVKAGAQKVYKCSRCKDAVSSFQLVEHNKTHIEETVPTIQYISRRPHYESDSGPLARVFEYQCNACGTVHDKRVDALECLQQHVDNDWSYEDFGLGRPYWKTLLGEQNIQVEQPVEDLVEDSVGLKDNVWKNWQQPFTQSNFRDHSHFFQCAACKLYYDNLEETQKHMSDVHGQDGPLNAENKIRIKRTISCQNCMGKQKFLFGDIKSAMFHRNKHHLKVLEPPDEQVITRLIFHMDGSEWAVTGKKIYFLRNILEEYQCICGQTHKSKSLVSNCLIKHVGIRRFKCNKLNAAPVNGDVQKLCGLEFLTQEGLENHDLQAHLFAEANSTMVCPHCGLKRTPNAMRVHLMTHDNERSPCSICGKLFRIDRLALHMKHIHQPKKKNYRCDVCFERYAFRASAQRCKARH